MELAIEQIFSGPDSYCRTRIRISSLPPTPEETYIQETNKKLGFFYDKEERLPTAPSLAITNLPSRTPYTLPCVIKQGNRTLKVYAGNASQPPNDQHFWDMLADLSSIFPGWPSSYASAFWKAGSSCAIHAGIAGCQLAWHILWISDYVDTRGRARSYNCTRLRSYANCYEYLDGPLIGQYDKRLEKHYFQFLFILSSNHSKIAALKKKLPQDSVLKPQNPRIFQLSHKTRKRRAYVLYFGNHVGLSSGNLTRAT